MRALTISFAFFIKLILFGMCGYMYPLWSQYWSYLDNQIQATSQSRYDDQINLYNQGYLPNDTLINSSQHKIRRKHSTREKFTYIKNSKPRFPNLQPKTFELDTKKYRCQERRVRKICDKKTAEFKVDIINELKKVFLDESRTLKVDNPYHVHYEGVKRNFMNKSPKELMCDFKKASVDTLKRSDIGNAYNLKQHLPKRSLFEMNSFNSCAIVASSGALRNSGLGRFIDSHEVVLRFNHAPTKGFEYDVGGKTTIRVLNSQVVARPEFNFLQSDLYKNVTLAVWDPSNYSASIDEWLVKPDFNLFPNFIQYRKLEKKPRLFIINPRSVWRVWDFLQGNSPSRLRPNPPSSGFLGFRLLLPFCNFVDIFEYIPSTRVTKRCHYYDPEENAACTFGVWHPLAAEKLLVYHMNLASDYNVFQRGFVRVTGFRNLDNC